MAIQNSEGIFNHKPINHNKSNHSIWTNMTQEKPVTQLIYFKDNQEYQLASTRMGKIHF